jgi:hypothetical protein
MLLMPAISQLKHRTPYDDTAGVIVLGMQRPALRGPARPDTDVALPSHIDALI